MEEFGYQPTDLDDELFMSDVPMEILMSSIKTQFEEPLEYRKKDYVQTYITKYQFGKDNFFNDDLIDLENRREDFLNFMLRIFESYLNVGIVDLDQMGEEEQNDIIHMTYRFFIKNIKKNLTYVIFNYINEHEDEFIRKYEKRKDVTGINFKEEIENDFDITILSNLGNIVDDAIENIKADCDVDEFFMLCDQGEAVPETDEVQEYYHECELTGNFVEKYMDMIDDDFLITIQSKIRNLILKKYPKRKRKILEQVEEGVDVIEDSV